MQAWRARSGISAAKMTKQDTVLSQGGPRNAAINFGTYRRLQQRHQVP